MSFFIATIERMTSLQKIPIYNDDENFVGFVAQGSSAWQALTIFGYQIALTSDRSEAEAILQADGLSYIKGVWQYYDKEDNDWHFCVIKEAYEHKVVVDRTTSLGFQDPNIFKQMTIENPTENTLIISA